MECTPEQIQKEVIEYWTKKLAAFRRKHGLDGRPAAMKAMKVMQTKAPMKAMPVMKEDGSDEGYDSYESMMKKKAVMPVMKKEAVMKAALKAMKEAKLNGIEFQSFSDLQKTVKAAEKVMQKKVPKKAMEEEDGSQECHHGPGHEAWKLWARIQRSLEAIKRSDAEPGAWVSAVMAHDCHDRLRLSRRRHRREQNGAKELKPCSVLAKTDKPYIDSVLEPGELDSIKKAGYMLHYEWRDTQYLAKYYPHYPYRYGCHVLKGSITKVNVGGESTGVESGDHSERPKDDAAVIRYIVDKYVYPDMQARAAVKSEIETDTTGTPGASSKEDHASKPPEALKENHAAIHAGWMDSALCQSDSAGSELLGFNDCVSDSAWE